MSRKAVIIILLCAAGLIYGIYSNAIPIPYNLVPLKSSDKVAYMTTYPVKVWYVTKTLTKKDVFTGGYYHEKVIRLFFENDGSDSVSFVVGGVAVVDNNGTTYTPDVLLTYYPVSIYPHAKTHVDVPFKKLPTSGWLYLDIFQVNGKLTGSGPVVTYKKLETVKLKFE
jgi:hypothetical protein